MAKKKVEITAEEVKETPAPEVQEKPKRTRKKAEPKNEETAKPVIKEAEKSAAGFDVQGTAWLYYTSVAPKTIKTITGKVYAWGAENSGRIPVTKNPDGAGKIKDLLGWVDKGDLK